MVLRILLGSVAEEATNEYTIYDGPEGFKIAGFPSLPGEVKA